MLYRYIDEKDLNNYEKENKKLSYYNLFYKDDDMILCNNISDDYEYLELQNDYDNIDIDNLEIYQYYIISDDLADRLMKYTDEIIYYHNKLDIYILGVTHFGTSWQYILTDFDLIKTDDNNWYKAIKMSDIDDNV